MIYLASPYTHKDKKIMELRAKLTMQACASLFYQNFVVYSPIVHWHFVAKECGLPTDHEPWLVQNEAMMKLMPTFGILRLDGWRESRGVGHEVGFTADLKKPTYAFDLIDGMCIPQGLFVPEMA